MRKVEIGAAERYLGRKEGYEKDSDSEGNTMKVSKSTLDEN